MEARESMPESQTLKGFALDVKPKVHPIPNQSFRCKYLYDLGLVAQSGDFSGPVTKVQGLTGQVHETGLSPGRYGDNPLDSRG